MGKTNKTLQRLLDKLKSWFCRLVQLARHVKDKLKTTKNDPKNLETTGEAAEKAMDIPTNWFQSLGYGARRYRRAIIEILILLFLVFLLVVSILEFLQESITIENINVPKSLVDRGYTSEVVAGRILDEIRRIRLKAGEPKGALTNISDGGNNQFTTMGGDAFADFNAMSGASAKLIVPGTSLSFSEIIDFLEERSGNRDPSVSGEFTCQTADCSGDKWSFVLRIHSQGGVVLLPEISANNIDGIFTNAAEAVLEELNPSLLGSYYNSIKAYPSAEALLRRMLTTLPRTDHYQVYLLLGITLADAENDFDGAISQYRKALELKPDFAPAFNNWGIALDRKGEGEEAIDKFRKALQLDPENSFTINNWGIALDRKGEGEEAIKKFRNAYELDPKNIFTLNNWGIALQNLKRYPEAIEKYRKADELEPNNVFTLNNWGIALQGDRKYPGAILKYRVADELEPDNVFTLNNWGLALQGLGKYTEATEKHRAAAEIDPKYPYTFNSWGSALERLEQLPEALEKYRKVLEIDKKGGQALIARNRIARLEALEIEG